MVADTKKVWAHSKSKSETKGRTGHMEHEMPVSHTNPAPGGRAAPGPALLMKFNPFSQILELFLRREEWIDPCRGLRQCLGGIVAHPAWDPFQGVPHKGGLREPQGPFSPKPRPWHTAHPKSCLPCSSQPCSSSQGDATATPELLFHHWRWNSHFSRAPGFTPTFV